MDAVPVKSAVLRLRLFHPDGINERNDSNGQAG